MRPLIRKCRNSRPDVVHALHGCLSGCMATSVQVLYETGYTYLDVRPALELEEVWSCQEGLYKLSRGFHDKPWHACRPQS